MYSFIKFPLEITDLYFPNSESAILINFIDKIELSAKKIQDFDLYIDVEKLVDEYNIKQLVFNNFKATSFHETRFLEQFLITNFLFEKWKITIYTDDKIEDIDKEKIKYFDFIKCGGNSQCKNNYFYKDENMINFSSNRQILYNSKFEKVSHNGQFKFN